MPQQKNKLKRKVRITSYWTKNRSWKSESSTLRFVEFNLGNGTETTPCWKHLKIWGFPSEMGVPPFLDGLPHGTSQSINGWGVTPFQETSIYENTKQFWASWIIWIGWTEASIPCPGSVSMPLTFRLVELWETSAVGWFAAWESFFLNLGVSLSTIKINQVDIEWYRTSFWKKYVSFQVCVHPFLPTKRIGPLAPAGEHLEH